MKQTIVLIFLATVSAFGILAGLGLCVKGFIDAYRDIRRKAKIL